MPSPTPTLVDELEVDVDLVDELEVDADLVDELEVNADDELEVDADLVDELEGDLARRSEELAADLDEEHEVDEELEVDLDKEHEADEDGSSVCAPYLARQMSCLGSWTPGVKDTPF